MLFIEIFNSGELRRAEQTSVKRVNPIVIRTLRAFTFAFACGGLPGAMATGV